MSVSSSHWELVDVSQGSVSFEMESPYYIGLKKRHQFSSIHMLPLRE
jgi:hypothetical protein